MVLKVFRIVFFFLLLFVWFYFIEGIIFNKNIDNCRDHWVGVWILMRKKNYFGVNTFEKWEKHIEFIVDTNVLKINETKATCVQSQVAVKFRVLHNSIIIRRNKCSRFFFFDISVSDFDQRINSMISMTFWCFSCQCWMLIHLISIEIWVFNIFVDWNLMGFTHKL